MDILFLGSVTDEDLLKDLSGASIAGNKMQLSIINALKPLIDGNISIVSVPSVAAFPIDSRLLYRKKEYVLKNGCRIIEVPFFNVPVIKQIMQMFFVYFFARRLAGKDSVVLSYNLYPQVGNAVIKLDKRGLKTAAILADLPIDDDYGKRHFLIQLMNRITERNIRKENHLIVLNENTISEYHPGASFIVMEGGCNVDCSSVNVEKEKMNIVFSGRLIEYNGICQLVEAMSLVKDENVFLDIYGTGPLENTIKEASNRDSRIRFFGFVENKKMLEIQKKAWLLINPRPVNDPISKVTFPSKIFEYLISGTPVLSTRLSCFSSEYDGLMFFCPSDSAEGIAEGINKVLAMNPIELSKRALLAKSYIQENKNWNAQANRIVHFLRDI